MHSDKLAIWLPSPLGDAILATPALRAIRQAHLSEDITYIATPTVRQFLTPCSYCNQWLETIWDNPLKTGHQLKSHAFPTAVLFKNSFSSALACFLAGIPSRVGYARDGRGWLLTEKLHPKKKRGGEFKPHSMIDYYLTIAAWMGCETRDRHLELEVSPQDTASLGGKLPAAFTPNQPVVVIVPGGAFGPSKLWPLDRWAQLADKLIDRYNAIVILSVAPTDAEIRIAEQVTRLTQHKIYSLADTPLSPGELKALIRESDLVVGNDTGPRHIAIALGRKAVTLFGPNNWDWTTTGYEFDIRIRAEGIECAPCDKPVCRQAEHLCMKAISVEMVLKEIETLLSQGTSGP